MTGESASVSSVLTPRNGRSVPKGVVPVACTEVLTAKYEIDGYEVTRLQLLTEVWGRVLSRFRQRIAETSNVLSWLSVERSTSYIPMCSPSIGPIKGTSCKGRANRVRDP